MKLDHAQSWQLILADLALILFLVTLSALAQEDEVEELAKDEARLQPQVAPSQALFRPAASGPTLREWLAQRPPDPRSTLTVFARHSTLDRSQQWDRANRLATEASEAGFTVRVVITQGRASDLHASLAYDALGDEAAP